MFKSVWWVTDIDFRISSGIVFSLMLVLWNRGKKKSLYPLRLFMSIAFMILGSYCFRTLITKFLTTNLLKAIGHSVYILFLSLTYILCSKICYDREENINIFIAIVSLTVYRLAWSIVKAITYGLSLLFDKFLWSQTSPMQSIFSYVLYAAIVFGCRCVYVKSSSGTNMMHINSLRQLYFLFALFQMLLEFAYYMLSFGSPVKSVFLFFTASSMYSIMTFVALLVIMSVDKLRQDKADMEEFIRSKQEYYAISREGILSLQTKCHDLKHQIALIRSAEGERQLNQYMSKLEDTIDEYSTVIDTGNQAIDVVLTEKNIICSNYGIRFTYIINGEWFNFLSEMENYALFGNLLDNAIESQIQVENADKRFISLKAAKRGTLIVLTVENYYEHELLFRDGELVTNKSEEHHHGFGVRSVKNIAESHGGDVNIHGENHCFKITMTMHG